MAPAALVLRVLMLMAAAALATLAAAAPAARTPGLQPLLYSESVRTHVGNSNVKLLELFATGPSTNTWSHGKSSCYRIPALVESKGVLLAFASERLGVHGAGGCGDEGDTNLVQRRSTDAGASWSNISLVVSAEVNPPVVFSSAPWSVADRTTGDVLLFFNMNSTEHTTCDCGVWSVRTSDGGLSWSAPLAIPSSSGVVGSSLDSGITLMAGPHRGRLVMCMRRICKNSCPGPWQAFAAYSDDRGATWRASPYLEEGTTECQVAELSTDGHVYMSIRPYKELQAKSKGLRASAVSTDGGATFGPAKFEAQLVNAGGVCGSVVGPGPPSATLFYSHPDATGRNNMTIYSSFDDAHTWQPTLHVYTGGSAYSSMAMLGRTSSDSHVCRVGLLFEKDGYKSMAFAAISAPC